MVVLGIKIGATWPYWLVLPVTVYWQYQQYDAIRTRDRQLCFQTFWQTTASVWRGFADWSAIISGCFGFQTVLEN